MRRPRAIFVASASILVFLLCSVVEAGDACCKAEAARRALIPDPFAVKPANWDDEDDGPWEAPKVAVTDLPAWYRWMHEVRLGLMGAAPWLIVGVVAAALLTTLLKPLFPSSALRSLLGSKATAVGKSNALLDSIRGSLFGLLVPFCSCGALPLAIALKQEGVSSSAIAAFVTAAQAAGVDSLFVTYGIFGIRVALLRLAAAGILAVLVGTALGTGDSDKRSEQPKKPSTTKCCDAKADGCGDEKTGTTPSLAVFVGTAVELFSSVTLWVVLGVMVSASASVWAPATSTTAAWDARSLVQSVASRAGLFLLSLPMTICEHGIVSLADALRGLGFSAGTAVALVVVGPSTNVGTLLMLSRLNDTAPSQSSKWIVNALKMTMVVVIFGVGLSYVADDLGSSIVTTTNMSAASSGGGSLPEWLNEHAVSVAGVLTLASILQSSLWIVRSSSSSKSCST